MRRERFKLPKLSAYMPKISYERRQVISVLNCSATVLVVAGFFSIFLPVRAYSSPKSIEAKRVPVKVLPENSTLQTETAPTQRAPKPSLQKYDVDTFNSRTVFKVVSHFWPSDYTELLEKKKSEEEKAEYDRFYKSMSQLKDLNPKLKAELEEITRVSSKEEWSNTVEATLDRGSQYPSHPNILKWAIGGTDRRVEYHVDLRELYASEAAVAASVGLIDANDPNINWSFCTGYHINERGNPIEDKPCGYFFTVWGIEPGKNPINLAGWAAGATLDEFRKGNVVLVKTLDGAFRKLFGRSRFWTRQMVGAPLAVGAWLAVAWRLRSVERKVARWQSAAERAREAGQEIPKEVKKGWFLSKFEAFWDTFFEGARNRLYVWRLNQWGTDTEQNLAKARVELAKVNAELARATKSLEKNRLNLARLNRSVDPNIAEIQRVTGEIEKDEAKVAAIAGRLETAKATANGMRELKMRKSIYRDMAMMGIGGSMYYCTFMGEGAAACGFLGTSVIPSAGEAILKYGLGPLHGSWDKSAAKLVDENVVMDKRLSSILGVASEFASGAKNKSFLGSRFARQIERIQRYDQNAAKEAASKETPDLIEDKTDVSGLSQLEDIELDERKEAEKRVENILGDDPVLSSNARLAENLTSIAQDKPEESYEKEKGAIQRFFNGAVKNLGYERRAPVYEYTNSVAFTVDPFLGKQ